jgi:hypothetical protein
MSNLNSYSALPGFRAAASLYESQLHHQTIRRQDSASEANRLVVPQLQMVDPADCIVAGDEVYCWPSAPGGGSGGGGGGGVGRSQCVSGDGKKVCNCPKNCFSSDTQCWCISYPPG